MMSSAVARINGELTSLARETNCCISDRSSSPLLRRSYVVAAGENGVNSTGCRRRLLRSSAKRWPSGVTAAARSVAIARLRPTDQNEPSCS